MDSEDVYAQLDELTEKYNKLVDDQLATLQQGMTGLARSDEIDRALHARGNEIERLRRTGISSEEIETHLDATDRYRHDF